MLKLRSKLFPLVIQILNACSFTTKTSFNLAHWISRLFTWLSYYRLELISKALPTDTNNCHLNTVNVIVCLVNIVIPAMVWELNMKEEYMA